jgi:predicted HTH domain antitoxin
MARIKYQEAAGMEVKRGRPSIGAKPEKVELARLYIQESRSIREIAEILGCKKDLVHYWLKKRSIPVRTMAKRSKLLKYSLLELKEGVEKKGIRGYARELGVDESTLRHHLQVRKR